MSTQGFNIFLRVPVSEHHRRGQEEVRFQQKRREILLLRQYLQNLHVPVREESAASVSIRVHLDMGRATGAADSTNIEFSASEQHYMAYNTARKGVISCDLCRRQIDKTKGQERYTCRVDDHKHSPDIHGHQTFDMCGECLRHTNAIKLKDNKRLVSVDPVTEAGLALTQPLQKLVPRYVVLGFSTCHHFQHACSKLSKQGLHVHAIDFGARCFATRLIEFKQRFASATTLGKLNFGEQDATRVMNYKFSPMVFHINDGNVTFVGGNDQVPAPAPPPSAPAASAVLRL